MKKITDFGALALVAVSLFTLELLLSRFEPALSGDVRHIQSFGDVRAELAEDTSPLKVLWLGNSITADGIVLSLADSVFEAAVQHETGVYAVHPDGSAIAEWVHIADNEFFDRDVHPEVMVIPFAWNLLADDSAVEAERIGRWYLRTPSDWVEFLRFDAGDFETGARAVIANASATFGNRERVRTRVLGALPGYQHVAAELSRGGRADVASAGPAPTKASTYTRLERLARAATDAGTHVVLVAMPVREPYEVDAGLLAAAARSGLSILDARDVQGLQASSFRDEMHLLPDGARTVTHQVALELVHAGHVTGGTAKSYAIEPAVGTVGLARAH